MSEIPVDRSGREGATARRWTSFVAPEGPSGKPVRHLHEQGNPAHRLRVEHNAHTLLVHLSGEDGDGWTTIAVDRATRDWAVAQGLRQVDTSEEAYGNLYGPGTVADRGMRGSQRGDW